MKKRDLSTQFLACAGLILLPSFFQITKESCDRIPTACSPCKLSCKRGLWRRCFSCPEKRECSSFCMNDVPIRKRQYYAKIEERFPLQRAIRERWSTDRVVRLLDEVDINVVDDERRTALHWASAFAYPELVELLLLKGADIDKRDYRGSTALHLAIKYYTPRPADRRKVIKQLLYDGASMYDRNFAGNNPFDSAYNSFNQRFALYTSEDM